MDRLQYSALVRRPAGAFLNLLNLLYLLCGLRVAFRGCRENFSLPGRGAAPHTFPISQSANPPKSPLCPLWFFVSFVIAA